MAIRGDLVAAELANVFQMFAMNRKRGVLTIRNRDQILACRQLYVDGSEVSLMGRVVDRPSAALLVEMGVLPYADWAAARSSARSYNVSPLEILMRRGRVSEATIADARERAQQEEILDVFLWSNITFTLDESQSPEAGESRSTFSSDHLIMEAARRQDEWRHTEASVGSTIEIYRRVERGGSPDLESVSDVARVVLDFVDGIRGSNEIIRESGLPRFFVDSALCDLAAKGWVEKLGLDDMLGTGDQLLEAGQVDDAIRLFRRALRLDHRNMTIHKRLAGCYLREQALMKAVAHYKFCARALAAAGHDREALTILQYVTKILPTDLRAIEEAAAIFARIGGTPGREDREMLGAATRLHRFLVESGQDARAADLGATLLALNPDALRLRLDHARILTRLGRTAEAVEAYLHAAEQCVDARDFGGALRLYKTLATLDPAGRPLYQIKVAEIRRQLTQRRVRRRHGRIVAVIAGLVVIGAVAYAIYHSQARSARDALKLRDPETHAEARRLADACADLARRFPLTTIAAEARELAVRYDRTAQSLKSAERDRDEVRRLDVERRAEAAAEQLARGVALIGAGRLEEASSAFEKASKLAPDATWTERMGLARKLQDVREYAAGADRLWTEAREAALAGNIAAEHHALAKIAAEYPLSARFRETLLPFRIEAVPPQAWVSGGGAEGRAPLVLRLPPGARSAVEVSCDGFRPSTLTLGGTPGRYLTTVVLARIPDLTLEIGDPAACAAGLDGGTVVVGSRSGRLTAVTTSPPAILWRHDPGGILSLRRAPVAVDGVVVAAAEGGEVFGVDATSGRGLFQRRLLGAVTVGPLRAGRGLILGGPATGGPGGRLLVIDPRTGDTLAGRDLAVVPVHLDGDGAMFGARLADGSVFLVDGDLASEPVSAGGGVAFGPAVAGEQVAIVDGKGALEVRDRRSGRVSVSVGLPEAAEADPILHGGAAVVPLASGELWMRSASGAVSVAPLGSTVEGSVLRLGGHRAALRTPGGGLVFVDLGTGRAISGYRVPGGTAAPPAGAGDRVVIGGSDGSVGILLWP